MMNGATTTNDLQGIWTVKVFINTATTITQVVLPFFQRDNPKQGSKQARDSILKLMIGMNEDVNPLNFRAEKKMDGTIDIYYQYAPGWTTLSGGWRPTITTGPYKIASMVISACEAVPLVKAVEIHLIENDTSKEIGLEELAMLDIKVKPVPDLNGGSSTSTSTSVDARHAQELQEARDEAARSAAEAKALRDQVELQAKHADDLRASLEQLRTELKEIKVPLEPIER